MSSNRYNTVNDNIYRTGSNPYQAYQQGRRTRRQDTGTFRHCCRRLFDDRWHGNEGVRLRCFAEDGELRLLFECCEQCRQPFVACRRHVPQTCCTWRSQCTVAADVVVHWGWALTCSHRCRDNRRLVDQYCRGCQLEDAAGGHLHLSNWTRIMLHFEFIMTIITSPNVVIYKF